MYCSRTCLSSNLWPCFKITWYVFEVFTLCTKNLRVVLEDLNPVLWDELNLYIYLYTTGQDPDLYLLCHSSGGRWTHPDNAWVQTLLPPPCTYWTPPPECWWLQTGLSLSPTQNRIEREILMVLELARHLTIDYKEFICSTSVYVVSFQGTALTHFKGILKLTQRVDH